MPPPPNIPYDEYLGDTTTTCDSAWDGDCEVGWNGHGEDDSLKLVTQSGTGDYAVRIEPGSTMPNGISKEFTVDSNKEAIEVAYLAWVHDGSATAYTRAVFKNSNGNTVSTQTRSTTVTCPSGAHEPVRARFNVPGNAATATVFIGAGNGSGTDPALEVPTPESGYQFPLILLYLAADADCGDYNCEATISCDSGEEMRCICDAGEPPSCIPTDECWCEAIAETCNWEG